jgi:hypothetical protein
VPGQDRQAARPRNHHKLLRHYKPKKIQRWHHRNGVAACIWKVPKHTKGLRITYSVQVKYAGHAATLVDTHRISRTGDSFPRDRRSL